MGIIQKRADELKPGDIIVVDDARYALQYVSLAAPGENMSEQHRLYCLAGLGRRIEAQPGLDRIGRWMPPDMPVHAEVPAPDLTMAQQHAEELADMLGICANQLSFDNQVSVDALALLDKIKPPEPPTLAEALAILAEVRADNSCHGFGVDRGMRADDLLDRARLAGLLP